MNDCLKREHLIRLALVAVFTTGTFNSPLGNAQEPPVRRGSASALLEEVMVTARKREEGAQEVPLSITAYNSEQIEALKVRDLFGLSTGMPNVVLDDVGTTRGTANFSIRGLGINSSIPGIDPTVGVFINGVYLGSTVSVIFDTFDVESIEVLRGPQGILFGRNVTGGAIQVNTKKPGDEFEMAFKLAADHGDEGDWNKYYMASVSGPLSDTFAARLTGYINDDDGWAENQFDGGTVGAVEQVMLRPTLVWTPTDTVELVFRYEYSDMDGDGPVSQTHTNGSGVPGAFFNADRDSFDVNYDEVGFGKTETDFASVELNWDVDFGEGTVTNIFGWRSSDNRNRLDVDGQPVWFFHAPSRLKTEQFSNELRYNGLFAQRANVTVGAYYFTNEFNYDESRELGGVALGGVAPALSVFGGGNLDVETIGLFAAVDYDLTDSLTLNAGLRYSYETKDAEVASLSQNRNAPCSVIAGSCVYDFVDGDDWTSWAPKLGVTYHLNDSARIYAHWSRGFRSGGYNMRNTSFDPADTPGPFDEEQVDNFEVGYKSSFGRGKLNAALFYNDISDMQRELNFPGPIGVIQLIRNTADASILGFEIDATYGITDNLLVLASVGYIDAKYDKVKADLDGDGAIDGRDKALDLPRAPELTYSLAVTHDLDIGSWGYMTSRLSYAHRDETAYTDSNLGFILEQDIVEAGLDFYSNDGRWVFSVYGKNLLDEVKHGGDTQLPDTFGGLIPWGGTFSPLSKGRVYGAEVSYNFF